MREKINRIVNFSIRDKGHAWYDWTMIVVVLISLLPLTTHKEYSLFRYTTVGYGDIYPQSAWGRAVSMVSALVGIAIIALPSGILTAGYMEEMSERRKKKRKKKENKPDKAM